MLLKNFKRFLKAECTRRERRRRKIKTIKINALKIAVKTLIFNQFLWLFYLSDAKFFFFSFLCINFFLKSFFVCLFDSIIYKVKMLHVFCDHTSTLFSTLALINNWNHVKRRSKSKFVSQNCWKWKKRPNSEIAYENAISMIWPTEKVLVSYFIRNIGLCEV